MVTTRRMALERRNLPLLLLQTRECVIGHFRPILHRHGVTEQQWRVLRALVQTGPMEPREIVQACRISSPSLAGMLARMEETGLVKRERVDRDQRRLRVSASARGRGLARRMAPEVEATYAALEKRLGRAFIERLHEVLDTTIAELGEPTVGPEDRS